MISDRDPQFTSEFFTCVFRRLGAQLRMSTANHLQSDGMTERTHPVISQILRSAVNHQQNNWEELLPWCEFAHNDMVQSSTCETPLFWNYGFHPLLTPEAVAGDGSPNSDWLALQRAREAIVIAKTAFSQLLTPRRWKLIALVKLSH